MPGRGAAGAAGLIPGTVGGRAIDSVPPAAPTGGADRGAPGTGGREAGGADGLAAGGGADGFGATEGTAFGFARICFT